MDLLLLESPLVGPPAWRLSNAATFSKGWATGGQACAAELIDHSASSRRPQRRRSFAPTGKRAQQIRRRLHRLLRRYGVKAEDFRGDDLPPGPST
jgi:hypothetical protein